MLAPRSRPLPTGTPATSVEVKKSTNMARRPPADAARDFAKVYLTNPSLLTEDAAQRFDAMVPDMGPETDGLVDMAPTDVSKNKHATVAPARASLRPGVCNPKAEDAERDKVAKVRVQTGQFLPPPILGIATVGAAGATLQAYASNSHPAYVVGFGALAGLGAYKLLELRAEALLDADDAR